MMARAEPHIIRSPANAMACSPEEQNLFIVTAEAETGTPARKLAIRATFRPCSASGIAQPRITSSISEGSTPGARLSASAMVTAANSSGRVERRIPFGAFPTAVLTAETITASCIRFYDWLCGPIAQQILDGVRYFTHFTVKQVVRGVDDREFLRFGGTRVKLTHLFQRADLIPFAVNEILGFCAGGERAEVVPRDRHGDAEKER